MDEPWKRTDASYCISSRQFVPHHNMDVTPITGRPTSAPPPPPPTRPVEAPIHVFPQKPTPGHFGRHYQNRSRDV